MEIIIISDTHGKHKHLQDVFSIPYGDVIIHAGDLTAVGETHEISSFLYWYSMLPHQHKIFIAGNHDLDFEYNSYSTKSMIPKNVIYLEDSGVEIEGIKFYGTPHTKPFQNWGFNKTDDKRQQYWDMIPDDTDVLITHCSPFGILDQNKYGENVGCKLLLKRVLEIKPKLHIFGDIHESYGVEVKNHVNFINASSMNEKYVIINKPIRFNI
jgi:Icc-related predicted phosphoesterase